MRMIRDNLRVAQSRQKSYTDTRRRELTFEVGDYVYLKVSPMRSVKRFNMQNDLKITMDRVYIREHTKRRLV